MADVTIKYKDAVIGVMDESGTKTVKTSGKYCEDDISVIYSGGSVPIEISTDEEMEAVLTSDNVGKVYKFIGTSDTYINGDLYIVEVG